MSFAVENPSFRSLLVFAARLPDRPDHPDIPDSREVLLLSCCRFILAKSSEGGATGVPTAANAPGGDPKKGLAGTKEPRGVGAGATGGGAPKWGGYVLALFS